MGVLNSWVASWSPWPYSNGMWISTQCDRGSLKKDKTNLAERGGKRIDRSASQSLEFSLCRVMDTRWVAVAECCCNERLGELWFPESIKGRSVSQCRHSLWRNVDTCQLDCRISDLTYQIWSWFLSCLLGVAQRPWPVDCTVYGAYMSSRWGDTR